MIIETDTFRSRYVVDKWEVEAQYKDLERVQIGTWFFGLFKKYKYQWSDWKNLEIKHDNNLNSMESTLDCASLVDAQGEE